MVNTDEIELRPLVRSDLQAFWQWVSDEEVAQYVNWDRYASLADAEKFLVEVVEHHLWFMAIVYRGEVAGSITLNKKSGYRSCVAELGYVLARVYWGQKIAYSCCGVGRCAGIYRPRYR
jgi:RimJ/RimL family protein N-acetyltransferase